MPALCCQLCDNPFSDMKHSLAQSAQTLAELQVELLPENFEMPLRGRCQIGLNPAIRIRQV